MLLVRPSGPSWGRRGEKERERGGGKDSIYASLRFFGGEKKKEEKSSLFSQKKKKNQTTTEKKNRARLAPQFRELRSASASDLLYVKEDCILPHDVTFHELISRRARGKSGPLFHFDVRDDVRLVSDASREKDESHAGKVVTRAWYGRNKHMFPASRWEVWDSGKGYGEYTVKGK